MSSSSAVPQCCPYLSVLSKLIAAQSVDTRLLLRAEMVRLVDPMIDSLFLRLIISSSVRPGAQPFKEASSRSTMSELCQLIGGEKETTNRLVRGQMDRLVNSLFLRLTNNAMLIHYIDATVDSQFASLRNSIETMIQSGVIGPNCDGTHFGMTLAPQTQTNTHQSSDECSHGYSNDQLTRTQEHQNILQNELSLANPDHPIIKQEFGDEEEEMYKDGYKFDDENVEKCENCEKRIRTSGDESSATTQHNEHAALEINQTSQLIISNDIFDTKFQIKQECLQGSSITSIPLDFTNNAAPSDISIVKQTEGQTTQIQTDQFDDNNSLIDDYCQEYLSNPNCANGVCNLDHENNNNHLNDDVSTGDGDETTLGEAQLQIDANGTTENIELQINDQSNQLKNFRREKLTNQSVIEPSTSGVRLSTQKRIQKKVFGDVQLNVNPCKKRKSDQGKSLKKVKSKHVLDDDEDTDDRANNPIEDASATEYTNDSIQANIDQSNLRFQCSFCHKSFDRNSRLQRHFRVHTGERPFQCDQCDKRFNQYAHLTTHQLIHQNIKNFQCHECDKQFNRKYSLDFHLLIHSGERPFECRHCEKSFTDMSTRKRHEQAIHLHVKPYRCKQCGHTATHRSHVIKHIRVVHFGLPLTIKQQQERNIIHDRDPREFVEKV